MKFGFPQQLTGLALVATTALAGCGPRVEETASQITARQLEGTICRNLPLPKKLSTDTFLFSLPKTTKITEETKGGNMEGLNRAVTDYVGTLKFGSPTDEQVSSVNTYPNASIARIEDNSFYEQNNNGDLTLRSAITHLGVLTNEPQFNLSLVRGIFCKRDGSGRPEQYDKFVDGLSVYRIPPENEANARQTFKNFFGTPDSKPSFNKYFNPKNKDFSVTEWKSNQRAIHQHMEKGTEALQERGTPVIKSSTKP